MESLLVSLHLSSASGGKKSPGHSREEAFARRITVRTMALWNRDEMRNVQLGLNAEVKWLCKH
jgi:hypothetical protein